MTVRFVEVGGPQRAGPREPIEFTDSDPRDYGSFSVLCPKCGEFNSALHATTVTIEGDDVLVTFWCEQCSARDDQGCRDDAYVLIIHQHKGATEIGWAKV